ALPTRFFDPRKSLAVEHVFLDRMFPLLRDLDRRTLSPREVEELEKILDRVVTWVGWYDESPKEVIAAKEKAMREGLKRLSPEARRFLRAGGRTAQQVDALPVAQAVTIYSVYRYRQLNEDFIKWLYVPYAQAQPGLKQARERAKAARDSHDGEPFTVLLTGYDHIALTMTRAERAIAALRCVEAVRL